MTEKDSFTSLESHNKKDVQIKTSKTSSLTSLGTTRSLSNLVSGKKEITKIKKNLDQYQVILLMI